MSKPLDPLTWETVEIGMEVAVYIPGLRRPLYGEVYAKTQDLRDKGKPVRKVKVTVFRTVNSLREANLEIDADMLEAW